MTIQPWPHRKGKTAGAAETTALTLHRCGITLRFADPEAPALAVPARLPASKNARKTTRSRWRVPRPGDRCPECGRRMPARGSKRPQAASLDHILPQQRGSASAMTALGVRNHRYVCVECNGLRAAAGHCWAALVCVKTVAWDLRQTPTEIMRRWRFGHLAALEAYGAGAGGSAAAPSAVADDGEDPEEKPHRNGGRTYRPEVAAAIRAEQRRLGVEAALERTAAVEFVHPAKTAAERVWNLATLAKHGVMAAFE